jgi:hypothetical protein
MPRYALPSMSTSFLLTTMVIVLSGIAILGVWIVLTVAREILAEFRQRRTAQVRTVHSND